MFARAALAFALALGLAAPVWAQSEDEDAGADAAGSGADDNAEGEVAPEEAGADGPEDEGPEDQEGEGPDELADEEPDELDADEELEGDDPALGEEAENADAVIEAAEVPDPEGAVPRAEIGRQIEEAFVTLQGLLPRLRRQASTLEVRRALPNFVSYVERLKDDPALEHLDQLHAAPLRDLENEWERAQLRLVEWQETLEARTAELTDVRVQMAELGALWQRTESAYEGSLGETETERTSELLGRIARVLRRIDRRLDEVLELQGELSDQGIAISRQASRIETAEQRLRDRRRRRDHRPLWRGWSRLDADVEAPGFSILYEEHRTATFAFVYTEKKSLFFHAFVFLAILGAFLMLRRAGSARLEPSRSRSARRALRARPVSAAVLLALALAPILYGYVPVALVALSLFLMGPAIVRLSVFLLPSAHRPVAALVMLAALSIPLSLGFVPEAIRRFFTLGLQAAALYFFFRLWRSEHTQAFSIDRAYARLLGFLRVAVVPMALAAYFLFAGYTDRAELWTTGTLWVFEQALGLFFGVAILSAALIRLLRAPAARVFYTVRDHRRKVASYLLLLLRWGAVLLLAVLALTSFDLLDPTLASSREAFSTTFTFGSIELSLGNVAAFFAMLIGTFIVMRLTHVLLEYELLPRFQLEQGIASAISLSASYLLVAIGVVLAFGVAGVGPERLALLGGALGVGIGFGLQNVVSNFVSGLILVAERPIKVGDVIEVEGDLVGTVQRIGIRSSTVHALNGADVIVPNSDLVSGRLINWTLSDEKRRIDLIVGAAYRHDPKEVMAILRRVVFTQDGVLQDPMPEVLCTSFGDSAIEYTVRAWATGYLNAIEVHSRLAAAVHEAFAEANIEIPFPQQDLYIKSAPEPD
ncbi:MAG: mechanosensitive ion channel domain-containing protein [Myxococcota bacterium]